MDGEKNYYETGKYLILVKVIEIFGVDKYKIFEVEVK